MRLLKYDQKKGFLHVKAETPEDLWLLSRLITPGCSVRGSTERKIKIGGDDARNQKVVRKKMTLTLQAEKATYEHDALRVLGIISDGPEDVARGEHHSITIHEQDDVKITKEWLGWELEKIKDAEHASKENILAVLFDRETALYARLTSAGYKILSSDTGDVQKKDAEEQHTSNFWQAISKQLASYDERYNPSSIIAGSPAFWKEYLKQTLSQELAKKTIYATISDTNEQALQELLKRPELKTALEEDRSSQEQQAIDNLLASIAKDQAAYGDADVEEKASMGNLKTLLISDAHLMAAREQGTYDRIEALMKAAEQGKTAIMIITTKAAMEQLDGLGGVAGTVRWQA